MDRLGISNIVLKFVHSRMSYKSRIRKALCAPTVAAAPGDTRWAHSPPQEPMRGHARAAAVACVHAAGRVGGPDRLFNGHAEPGTGWWCAMLLVARVVSSLLATRRPRGCPHLGKHMEWCAVMVRLRPDQRRGGEEYIAHH